MSRHSMQTNAFAGIGRVYDRIRTVKRALLSPRPFLQTRIEIDLAGYLTEKSADCTGMPSSETSTL